MCTDSLFLQDLLLGLISSRYASSTGTRYVEVLLETLTVLSKSHALAVVRVNNWLWNFANGEIALILVEIYKLTDLGQSVDAVGKLFPLEGKDLLIKQGVVDGQFLAVTVEAFAR